MVTSLHPQQALSVLSLHVGTKIVITPYEGDFSCCVALGHGSNLALLSTHAPGMPSWATCLRRWQLLQGALALHFAFRRGRAKLCPLAHLHNLTGQNPALASCLSQAPAAQVC